MNMTTVKASATLLVAMTAAVALHMMVFAAQIFA